MFSENIKGKISLRTLWKILNIVLKGMMVLRSVVWKLVKVLFTLNVILPTVVRQVALCAAKPAVRKVCDLSTVPVDEKKNKLQCKKCANTDVHLTDLQYIATHKR